MSVRSKIFRLAARVATTVASSRVGQRIQSTRAYEKTSRFVEDRFYTATQYGKDAFHQWEGKRYTFAEALEKEIDLQAQYQRIETRMAEDLAELEMRKAMLEKTVQGQDRLLFNESYEYARKKIINAHMYKAAQVFYPQSSNKLKNDLFTSLAKVLRGEKITPPQGNPEQ